MALKTQTSSTGQKHAKGGGGGGGEAYMAKGHKRIDWTQTEGSPLHHSKNAEESSLSL